MLPIRDNQKRNHIALIFIVLSIAITFIQLIVYGWQYYLFIGYEAGNVTVEKLQETYKIGAITGPVGICLDIGLIVSFIMWFRRAYWNLHQVNVSAAHFPEGWAAGAWFVPFINLIRPYRIMQQIWKGTLH